MEDLHEVMWDNNFEEILLNAEKMKDYLKRLKENCSDFFNKFEHGVLESISKSAECVKRVEKSSEILSELTKEKKRLKNEIDSVKLEQKIIEKKAINTMKEIEETKNEIAIAKEKTEQLSLAVVDLQRESDKSKEHMKKHWDAIKRANAFYKNILDINIYTEMSDNIEHVTVIFFWSENPTDKKFSVILTSQDNCWKVKKIEPELSMENKYHLNHIVQFSKQSEIANVTVLLYELRQLFLKMYFDK